MTLRKKNVAKGILDHIVETPERANRRQLVKHLTSDQAVAVLESEGFEKMLKDKKKLTAKKRKEEGNICQKCNEIMKNVRIG